MGVIPIARPLTGDLEAEAAGRVIRSGWVTQGPEVAEFERDFAACVGARHACAVSNCTTALHLALKAAGVRQGDEVITVSHSFIATANSISYCGATPVFIDIRADTFNMNPELIENALSGRTRAILCVHQIGMPCDLSAILKIARERNIPVIEDAACAIGSEILWNGEWQKIGKPHADIACFSFHPRKVITTGDGGMLTTSNPEHDRKFRLWRQHGMSVADTVRHASAQVVFESYEDVGYNYRMTDIQAAVGREQLKRLPEIIARRRHLANRYHQGLSDTSLSLPVEPTWARSNWQSYCVRLPENMEQRAVMQRLLDLGIATRRGVMCAHRESAYRAQSNQAPRALLQSELAQDYGIVLPLFHQITEAEQDYVIDSLRRVLRG